MKTSFQLFIFSLLIGNQLAFSQCNDTLPNLGIDTTICQGQSITLNPGNYASYLWDDGSTSPTRTVTQSGTYVVQVGTLLNNTNIIVNGNFEAGNTGFTTGYTHASSNTGTWGLLSQEGYYTIGTSPSLAHSNFDPCEDHTPAPGNQMLIVNGASTPTNVWCQMLTLVPNTDYYYGAWISNALTNSTVAQLQFNINNSPIGAVFATPETSCNWVESYQVWNSGNLTSAEVCITNQNTTVSGNDFMIDDITFSMICYDYDTIQVTVIPTPVVNASPNDSICVGEFSNIVASGSSADLTYTWNPGNIQSQTLAVSPATQTTYTVVATNNFGCTSAPVSRTVFIRPTPTVNIIPSDSLICSGSSVFLYASSTPSNLTYIWNNNATGQQISDTVTSTSTYSVQATNAGGCSAYDTVVINVIPPLTIAITGNTAICPGESTTLNATGNFAGMNFTWENNSQGANYTTTTNSATYIHVTGSYGICPQARDSILLTMNPIPTLVLPETIQLCKGETREVTIQVNPSTSTIHWIDLGSTGPTQTLAPTGDGYYSIYASNGNCISATQSFYVDVIELCDFEVPNVFTPNNDGSNDHWKLMTIEGIETLECVILNRWGNVIRTFNTTNFQWDGTDNNNNPVMEGVYFYRVVGKTVGGEEVEKHGFITLEK